MLARIVSANQADRRLRKDIIQPMYGVPEDLPLQRFVGEDLNQICLGQYQIQFHFSGTGSISVEGQWELRDASGELLDRDQEHPERDCYRIHKIIDLPVTRFTIDAPRSFTLFFDGGYALTVFDDTPQYESFSVHLDGEADIYI